MKRYKTTGIIISAILICVISFIWFFSKTEASLEQTAMPAEKQSGSLSEMMTTEKSFPSSGKETPEADISDEAGTEETDEELNQVVIVARLNDLFAGRMDHAGVQLQAIEKLIGYLKEIYPENWQAHVYEYLTLAFPERAAALYDNFHKLMDYKQWVANNYMILLGMKTNERKAFLWDKRKTFFGDDVEQIWEMEIKGEKLTRSLEQINETKIPFNEKVNYYLVSIDSIYDNQAETYKQAYQQNMIDKFLTLKSVQADLQDMAPEERKENLADLRCAMGMDAAALNRWSELDDLREQRWENGRSYMQARADILNEPGGPDREYQLDQLRQTFFGEEAETIKNEETSGLFRFTGPRVFGKN